MNVSTKPIPSAMCGGWGNKFGIFKAKYNTSGEKSLATIFGMQNWKSRQEVKSK